MTLTQTITPFGEADPCTQIRPEDRKLSQRRINQRAQHGDDEQQTMERYRARP